MLISIRCAWRVMVGLVLLVIATGPYVSLHLVGRKEKAKRLMQALGLPWLEDGFFLID